LSDEDLARFLASAVKTKGEITEDAVTLLVEWAQSVRLDALMLDMVIAGQMGIAAGDGEPIFVHPDHTKESLR
jgi:hypothetical protein